VQQGLDSAVAMLHDHHAAGTAPQVAQKRVPAPTAVPQLVRNNVMERVCALVALPQEPGIALIPAIQPSQENFLAGSAWPFGSLS
jgi:hypothetical protein